MFYFYFYTQKKNSCRLIDSNNNFCVILKNGKINFSLIDFYIFPLAFKMFIAILNVFVS